MKSEITDLHHLVVGPVQVAPIASVRNLGALVYLDSVMMMKTHVTQLVSSCFGILRQIRSIRPSLPRATLTMLISSFIMSKLDYCNVALVGLTRCDLDRLHACSLSLTPPLVSRWVRSTTTTSHLFSSTFTGCGWLNVYSTNSVYILVYRCHTDQHLLPSTDSLSGGKHGITASSAVIHSIRPDGACYTEVNTG